MRMSEYIPKKAQCVNCLRYRGEYVDLLQGANGEWVHPFRDYAVKCHPFESWVALPKEEE